MSYSNLMCICTYNVGIRTSLKVFHEFTFNIYIHKDIFISVWNSNGQHWELIIL